LGGKFCGAGKRLKNLWFTERGPGRSETCFWEKKHEKQKIKIHIKKKALELKNHITKWGCKKKKNLEQFEQRGVGGKKRNGGGV